jgi:hypothetical protein
MQPYTIRQRDEHRQVISEENVEATTNESALRQLKALAPGAEWLEVVDQDGATVREIGVSYWKRRTGRR